MKYKSAIFVGGYQHGLSSEQVCECRKNQDLTFIAVIAENRYILRLSHILEINIVLTCHIEQESRRKSGAEFSSSQVYLHNQRIFIDLY